MNKIQLSNILKVITDPMHGKEFYDRNSLTDLLNEVDSIVSNIEIFDDTPQANIIQIINDYIKNNVKFRREYLDKFYGISDTFDEGELIYRTAYAALIKKEAVCSGFTEAMRVLLAYYGIESKTIIAKLPRRCHNPTCHYLLATFLNDGSIKILDPERQIYCERKGYDFQEYLNKLEFAIPNEICSMNKLANDGVGMFANDYLARNDVKKANGIKEVSKLLEQIQNIKEIDGDIEK